ncbi:MAG: O-antigen polymerase [Fimbriimonadales bacterium]
MLLVGVSLLVVGHQLWLWARRWRFDVLHPYVLCDVMIFALFGLGSLVVEHSHTLLSSKLLFDLYILTGLIAYYLGLHVNIRVRLPKTFLRFRLGTEQLRRHQNRIILITIASVLVLTIIILQQRSRVLGISIAEILLLPPLYVYTILKREGVGAFMVIVFYILSGFLMLFLYSALSQRRYVLSALVLGGILGSTLLLSVTRVPLIMALMLPVAYYHYSVRPLNRLFLVGIVVVAPILLTVLNNYRSGGGWTVLALLKKETIVLESLGTLWNRYYDGTIALEYGANYFYYTPLTFVPRFLWQEKPETSFETRWTIELFGSVITDFDLVGVHTFTPWGEGLVQFGVVGGAINLFLFGLIINSIIKFYKTRFYAQLVFYNLTLLSVTFIRTGVQAILFTTLIYVITTLIYEKFFYTPSVSGGTK